MKNIFAEVYVPALDLTLDLLIPCGTTVCQAAELIANVVDKKTQVALDTGNLRLYDAESRVTLPAGAVFDKLRVPDACSLILV